jgi:DNA-binding transcriptional LysR family regulator
LSNEPFILFSRKSKPLAYNQVITLCHMAGFSPQVVQEVENEPAQIGLVAAGIGVSLTTASLRKMRSEEIAYRVIDPPLYMKIVLAWKPFPVLPQVQSLLFLARKTSKK